MSWTLLGRTGDSKQGNSICNGMEVWKLVCYWSGGQWEGVGCKFLLIGLEEALSQDPPPPSWPPAPAHACPIFLLPPLHHYFTALL